MIKINAGICCCQQSQIQQIFLPSTSPMIKRASKHAVNKNHNHVTTVTLSSLTHVVFCTPWTECPHTMNMPPLTLILCTQSALGRQLCTTVPRKQTYMYTGVHSEECYCHLSSLGSHRSKLLMPRTQVPASHTCTHLTSTGP